MDANMKVKSNCGMCHSGCNVIMHLENGVVSGIEGEPGGPFNKGALCPLGLASIQILYHPDRIKYPQKRTGQRGEGKWERISWDEALDTISGKIKQIRDDYGPLAVAISTGTARPVKDHVRRFLNIWGTPNRIGYPHNCMSPQRALGNILFGSLPRFDLDNSRCVSTWGYNMTHTFSEGYSGKRFIDGLKRGAKLICMDPYLTPMASKSDIWLQLRPGTDCAMALAWINVIITEKLYDEDFVDKWTSGFDKLAEHVKPLTPEWAEQITWVPADKIRRAARLYATTKPACLLIGVAPEFGVNTTDTMHSLFILPAITGNMDVPGGNVFWEPTLERKHITSIVARDRIPQEVWDNSVARDHKLLSLGEPTAGHYGWRAVLTSKPYPIKAVLFHAANPLAGHENPKGLVYQAMQKLEFISVMDHFMTPTAEMADIVLPASTWLERDDIYRRTGPNMYASPRVIEPLWESRDDADVFRDILKRVGLDWGFDSVPEMLDYILKPLDMTWDQFKEKGWITAPQRWIKHEQGLMRSDGTPGFNTTSGKIELYSTTLEQLGLDPLPVHKEPPESPVSAPDLAKDYPLVLTTGIRSPVYFHSQYRQLPWLREIHPEPIVRIHPETAEELDIGDGDWIYIESPRGRCKQKAKLTLGIDPRVVLAEHSWWYPEQPGPDHAIWDYNINLLVSSDPPYDPGLASTPARSLLCKVYKDTES
ncbi:molybdopterin-dependent oxidoreductase [Chloroflexota bacterium]